MEAGVGPASFIEAFGFSALGLLLLVLVALAFSSYVKIITVLGMLRVGLGFYSVPSAFVTGGLAIALAFFVMYPTLTRCTNAMDEVIRAGGRPVSDMQRAKALDVGFEQWKGFLKRHVHAKEVQRFSELAAVLDASAKESGTSEGTDVNPASWRILAPAFLVSELKEAFATGLSLFLPFLIIDLLVANILLAIGLERVSIVSVAFPFKLLLFVTLDGWSLITGNLVATYAG